MEVEQQTYEIKAQAILDRLSLAAKKKRLSLRLTQEEAAFEAGVTIKTVQSLEQAKNTHMLKSMTYLVFLGLGNNIMQSMPNPERLTPIEQMSISKGKIDSIRRARVSRKKATPSTDADDKVSESRLSGSPWKTQ
jgi:DNA-binding XRE family transcriptional regulator